MATGEKRNVSQKQKFSQIAKRFYKRFGINHFVLIGLLVAYSFIGGVIFHYIEGPNERLEVELAKNETIRRRDSFATGMIDNLKNCTFGRFINEPCLYEMFHWAIVQHEENLNIKTGSPYPWDFWNSMFYAGTLSTTIGYGHMYCKTVWGRAATIIYATIGIPLILTILNDLGNLLFRHARKGWNIILRLFRRIFHLKKRSSNGVLSRLSSMVGGAAIEDFDQENFPLLFAVFIVFAYIFGCSAIFKIWESNWDYFTAFYFFFVSLSTIGLGDIVPDHPRFALMGFAFIIVGLSLVSMCINVLQARFESAYKSAVLNLEAALLEEIESSGDWDADALSDIQIATGPSVPSSPDEPKSPPLSAFRSSVFELFRNHPELLEEAGDHKAALGVLQLQMVRELSRRKTRRNTAERRGSEKSPQLQQAGGLHTPLPTPTFPADTVRVESVSVKPSVSFQQNDRLEIPNTVKKGERKRLRSVYEGVNERNSPEKEEKENLLDKRLNSEVVPLARPRRLQLQRENSFDESDQIDQIQQKLSKL